MIDKESKDGVQYYYFTMKDKSGNYLVKMDANKGSIKWTKMLKSNETPV